MDHRDRTGKSRQRQQLLVGLVCLAGALAAAAPCASASHRSAGPRRVAPTALPISAPEAQGVDSEALATAVDFLREHREELDVHSLNVVRNGHTVADVSFYPYQPGSLHNLASVSKVFLTTLVGIAIDEGLIESVNERVVDLFPDRSIGHLDERKRALTVEHLLTMTSGLGSVDLVDSALMKRSSDWVQFALDLPMSHAPGTQWNYHQPSAFLLSAILTEATGMTAHEFAREHLFSPLGILDSHWTASPDGASYGYSELKLMPSDVVKFGQMILQRGAWQGEQLVSREWVEASTTPVVAGIYGYMWYRYPELPDCIVAAGARGQRLVVVPSLDLVVLLTGGGPDEATVDRVFVEVMSSHILPAVRPQRTIAANAGGEAKLAAAVERAAAVQSEPRPLDSLPELAAAVAGTTFELRPNGLGLQTLSLSFLRDDEARLRFRTDGKATYDRSFQWAAGLDGVERCVRGMLGAVQCGTGRWLSPTTFEMSVDLLGLLARYRLSLEFSPAGDRVAITFEDLDWWEPTPSFVLIATKQQ